MKTTIFFGNDINNQSNDISWLELLHQIIEFCHVDVDLNTIKDKQFPLLYEEIFLKAIKKNNIPELDLKKYISEVTGKIRPNYIHNAIFSMKADNFITTNYDYAFQKSQNVDEKNIINSGIKNESTYNMYRHNIVGNKKIWHIHGEKNRPSSIILGFEHYGSTLKYLKEYISSGNSVIKEKQSLIHKLERGEFENDSWIELFFNSDIHIVGLNLDFVELDVWWLLTYRARLKEMTGLNIQNSIKYYCPSDYVRPQKKDLMDSFGIETVQIPKLGKSFYDDVLEILSEINSKETELAYV